MASLPPVHPLRVAPPRESLRTQLAVIVGYVLLGVLWTRPLVWHMGSGVIQKGDLPIDAGQGVWNLWWTRSMLLLGESPLLTRQLFFPLEQNLLYQTLSLPNGILVAPVLFGVGPVAAFNTLTLLSFALGGYAVYRLARGVGADRVAALLAGFVFVAGPYHMQRIWSGPMELIAIQWVPFYLLLLGGALLRPTPLRIIGAGLLLLITTLASQYYGLYAAIYTAAYVSLAALLAPAGTRLSTFGVGVGVGAVWAGTLLPLLLASGELSGAVLEDWYMRQVYHSVALFDLFVPNTRHPLWGGAAEAWHAGWHPFGPEGGASIGLGIVVLIGVALRQAWARSWPWLLLAILMLLLAMGPQLRLTEAESALPGPFLLLNLIGPFRNSSRPSIFVALMLIPLALLVAIGLTQMRATLRRPLAWPNLLLVLVLLEALVRPWPIMPLQAAERAAIMASDPLPGAVLELPPRNNDSRNLLNQICHGRPLIGGYLARLPDYRLARYPSAMQQLWNAEAPRPDILDLDPARELAALGVRFVALDLTELPRFQATNLRAQLDRPGITVLHASEQAEVYALDPAAAQVAAVLDAGWYDVEQDGGRTWRWMGDTGTLGVIAPADTPTLLQFTATAYGSEREVQIRQGTAVLGTFVIPTAPFDRTITLRIWVPAGQSTLTLSSPAEPTADGRTLSLSVSALRLIPLPVHAAVPLTPAEPLPAQIAPLTVAPCGGKE